MKIINKYILVLLTVMMTWSCEGFLDKNPTDELSSDLFWRSKGDFDNAKEHYKKAAKMAGLREKLSIHTNAYNAYVSLMQTDNPEDGFIKFLKQNFLS